VEFYPYPEVPAQAVAYGKRIMSGGGLDVGGVEYLETQDGRLMFYDINANSNLRPSVAQAFGFDPFERVADFLAREMRAQQGGAQLDSAQQGGAGQGAAPGRTLTRSAG
jgi:hypothetical protein